MGSALVSVIVPSYNEARYLRQMAASILGQTHAELELIVIDDGSTDDSLRILGEIGDARLRVVTQPNSGSYVARNRGISEARGEYIALQDADDISMPTRLESQVRFLEEHPDVDGVGTQIAIFQDGMRRAVQVWALAQAPEAIKRGLARGLGGRSGFCFATVMFRAHVLKPRMPFYPENMRYSGDWVAFKRRSQELRYANLATAEYLYRISGDTCSFRKSILQNRNIQYAQALAADATSELTFQDFLAQRRRSASLRERLGDARIAWNWLKFRGRLVQVRLLAALGRGIVLPESSAGGKA